MLNQKTLFNGITQKYFEIINLLLIDKFEEDEFDLNIFIGNHRNVILKILDDELLSENISISKFSYRSEKGFLLFYI